MSSVSSHIVNENGDQQHNNGQDHSEEDSEQSANSDDIKLQGPVRPQLPPIWFKEPTALCLTG